MNAMMYALGNAVLSFIEKITVPKRYEKYILSALTGTIKIKKKNFYDSFINEVYNAGVSSIPIILILGFTTGFLIFMILPSLDMSFGFRNIYGGIFNLVILQQFAPIVTSSVVVIRCTIYITVNIARMKTTGEFDTLEILGINPVHYLGAVRILAGVVTVPLLGMYFLGTALVGTIISTFIFHGVPVQNHFTYMFDFATNGTGSLGGLANLFLYIFKCAFTGFIIYTSAIYVGLTAKKKSGMIIQKTIQAITTSIFWILIFNLVLTVVVYGTT